MSSPERLERVTVPALDAILGEAFAVLDRGFVRVIDYMGGDASIVRAARVSYGAGTRRLREDRGLIRYLMRHHHTTPFEMAEITLHVRVPMDTWRQWIRHRTASVNEYSTRYSLAIDDMQETAPDQWRLQSTGNRQGSDGFVPDASEDGNYGGKWLSVQEQGIQELAREVYQERIKAGVAREQARKDLPLSTYTEAYWKCDLHNLLHFLQLRMDAHAQLEIQQYATVIGEEIVARWCPLAWEAFQDYRQKSIELTAADIAVIHALNTADAAAARTRAVALGLIDETGAPTREGRELADKLVRLNMPVPWEVES